MERKQGSGRAGRVVWLVILFFGYTQGVQAFDRLVVFGDSLSDPGNAFVLTRTVSTPPYQMIPDAPYAHGGLHFSNGETWVEQLAADLGQPRDAGPAWRTPRVGSNYAVGGSRARNEGPVTLATQIGLFLGHRGVASADDLYVVFIGGNDVRDAIALLERDPTGAASMAVLEQARGAIGEAITVLVQAGARQVMVANAPNLGLVPAVAVYGPQAQAVATGLSLGFNTALASTLDELGDMLPVQISVLDLFSVLTAAVTSPATPLVTDTPCIHPGQRAMPACPNPGDYLFWDGIHPTQTGHKLIKNAVATVLGVAAP